MIFTTWSACLSKLPTIDSLRRRGFSLANRCEMCLREEESVQHLLRHCNVSCTVWAFIFESFKIVWCMTNTVEQLLQVWPLLKLPARGKKLRLATTISSDLVFMENSKQCDL
ncbi:Reverse transcriptase zinc-binding domain [Macleaya cordata]|uniref:Reverse transcriptase zinc-binding domain n=1 Tax=Macleaya cordata TaxID=56857 RepID=A0A200QH22_MACCD|nr:Reverse transcriptase zinc-binding domain [Macleaya cordata]